MTITELTKIIQEVIETTEENLVTYAEITNTIINVTIQVMEALKGVTLDKNTRDLKHALLVQKIVRKVETKLRKS